MTMQRHSFTSATTIKKVWKSAQLMIGFHKDQKGRKRDQAKTWLPENGRAGINADPSQQETFVTVEAASGNDQDDVLIKLQQDQIVVRREQGYGWQGIMIKDGEVIVRTPGGAWVKIEADGTVIRQAKDDETVIDATGGVQKRTEYVDAMMSPDGVEMARATPENIAVVTAEGVTCKPRDR